MVGGPGMATVKACPHAFRLERLRLSAGPGQQGFLGCLHAFDTSQLTVVELPGDLLLQATQASPPAFAQPVMIHAFTGKQHLQALAGIPKWQTLKQALLGTDRLPAWLQGTWHVSAGLRFVFPQQVIQGGRAAVIGCPAPERWARAFHTSSLRLPLLAHGSDPTALYAVSRRTEPIADPVPANYSPFPLTHPIEIHCCGLGATALAEAGEGTLPHVQVLTGGGGGCYGPGEARVDDARDPNMLRCALSVSAYAHDITMRTVEATGQWCWAQVRGLPNSSRQALELLDLPPLVAHWAPPRHWWIAASQLLFGFMRQGAWTDMYRVLTGYEQEDSAILGAPGGPHEGVGPPNAEASHLPTDLQTLRAALLLSLIHI